MKKSRGVSWGIILIAMGVLLLLDNLDFLDFGEILHTYWPALLILLGLSILARRPRQHSTHEDQSPGSLAGTLGSTSSDSDSDRLSSSTVFGDYRVAVQSREFCGGTVSTTFGDMDIDLLNAQLAEGEHSLKLEGVFGNTILQLPRDTAFSVFANTTFGDIRLNDQKKGGISSSLDYASPDFHLASKRLRVSVSRVFGNVTVTS